MSARQILFGSKPAFLFSLVLLFVVSCKQSPEKQQKVQPNKFVSAYTNGNISSQSTVRVVLNLPEERLGVSKKEPPQNVFLLKPSVEGKTYWADQYTLVFEPAKPLQNGQKYEAIVDLNKLLGVNDKNNGTFRFHFRVVPLTFGIIMSGLEPYTETKSHWNILEGRLMASDHVPGKEIDGLISAKQGGRSLPVHFVQEPGRNTWDFTIDSVERMTHESTVELEWHGKMPCSRFDESGKLRYPVPSKNNFRLKSVKVINTPDQYIKLEFTDPPDPEQNLDGLIYFTDNTSFRLQTEGNSVLVYPSSHQEGEKTIMIKKQVTSNKGIQLKEDFLRTVNFGMIKPQVRFVNSGSIMPGKDGWTIPFEAVNLSAVDVFVIKIYSENILQFLQVNRLTGSGQLRRVGKLIHKEKIELNTTDEKKSSEWNTYALDLSKMIKSEPGAIYRVELRFRKSYSLCNCGEDTDNEASVDDTRFGYYSAYESYYYPRNYRWRDRDDPCTVSYYTYRRFAGKNVMASNIGLTVKEDGNRLMVFTNNLETTKPMSGVKITLYDYQQQELVTARTAQDGKAIIDYKGVPYLLVAEKDRQYGYQRLDGGSALSYSKFDTKGVSMNKGIKGYIYGERGVWRPGDTLFLTVIVDDSENPLPEGHPVILKLTNPRGREVVKKTKVSGMNGFYAFHIPTDENALTGFWNATAEVGGATFNKKIRIETIKPNRLKIKLDPGKKLLESGKNKATLEASWLHGGIAANLKADVNITIRPGKTVFEKYEGYNFDDPARIFPPEDKTVFDGKLNSKGIAVFEFDLPDSKFAPGMLKVNFVTKVFEQSGDFSTDQTSARFAPFNTFVGIKGPEPEPGAHYLETDKPLEFEVATVSKEGLPKSVSNMEYEVYKLGWSWWYGSNNSNLASYISNHYDQKVVSGTFDTKNGKGKFSFQLHYPDWGRYYVLVKQPGGGHQTGMKIYVDWPSMYSRENRKVPGGMTLLSLSTDKEKYNVGDEVKVSVPTPANGRLLVALEKGNRQIRSWEMKATGAETLITFKAEKEMTPNVYLYVSVLQPHDQTVNDLPIRMYGLVPVMIEDRETVLEPVVNVPETVRPESTYSVSVSEKNNREMTYTIAIVDDGLLDLTHFKTPAPHKYFYAKEALAVKTWDIYDDVMGAFGKRLEKVFAIGGDMEEKELTSGKKKANRFKPVVTFLGPFHLKNGKTARHEIKMPNYIGSVRCMVVAGENGAYGHTQKNITVKQPLMVLGTLPRVLAPGETVKLPASVFVMDSNISEVSVAVETNGLFDIKKANRKISVKGEGEYMAWFDLQVTDKAGTGKVKIAVKSGSETASYEIEIPVRNPNKRVYNVEYHMLKPDETQAYSPVPVGMDGTNEFNLTVSGIPPLNLDKRLDFLVRYPYGCIEQTVSSVFPQLFLGQLMKLDEETRWRTERNIKSGIQRLSRFQLADGGFSYWPGNYFVTDWGTSYAGHFLILAREKGYNVPYGMYSAWIDYQRQTARNWRFDKYKALNQTYRLYTLALAGEAEMGAMNRLRANKDLPVAARYRLAAAYALAGQKQVALELLRNIKYSPDNQKPYWRYSYGSEIRDLAMVLETYELTDNAEKAIPVFNQIADKLKSSQWMSTQTTAYALYAISQFVENDSGKMDYEFQYTWNGESSGKMNSDLPVYATNLVLKKKNKLEVKNLSDKNLFVTLTGSGIPLPGDTVNINHRLKMKIRYFTMDGKPLDVRNVTHGTDFYAEVTVHNLPGNGNLENVALSQVFPSGWEIINTRMLDLGSSLKSDKSDFVDFRDDRVDVFFSLYNGETKRFVVLLNAAYQGKYYLPVTRCAPMYDNSISAASGGGWVIVGK